MKKENSESEKVLVSYARVAGFMYLFIIIIYMAGLMMNAGFHSGDFVETSQNISTAEGLYRTSLLLMLMGSVLTIPLAGALYIFLKVVDPNLALLALLWRICETVLGAVTKVLLFMRLGIFTGTFVSIGIVEQDSVSGLLRVGANASFNLSVLFFSFGSILFYYLLLKSRFIPRSLSILGIFASGWVTLLACASLVSTGIVGNAWWLPMFVAEIVTGLWLLFKGIDLEYWNNEGNKAVRIGVTT